MPTPPLPARPSHHAVVRTPEPLAAAARLWLAVAALTVVAGGVLASGVLTGGVLTGGAEWPRWIGLVLLSAGPLLSVAALVVRCRSLARQGIRARGMLCLRCAYPVASAPDDGAARCPECHALHPCDSALRRSWLAYCWLVRPSAYRRASQRHDRRHAGRRWPL